MLMEPSIEQVSLSNQIQEIPLGVARELHIIGVKPSQGNGKMFGRIQFDFDPEELRRQKETNENY